MGYFFIVNFLEKGKKWKHNTNTKIIYSIQIILNAFKNNIQIYIDTAAGECDAVDGEGNFYTWKTFNKQDRRL